MMTFVIRVLLFGAFICLFASTDARGDEPPMLVSYKTADQVKAMAPCSGIVEGRAPCYVVLRRPDGTRFRIGSPGNTPEFSRFVASLKEGVSYAFPAALIEHEKQGAAR
jgi:hypothetical protein